MKALPKNHFRLVNGAVSVLTVASKPKKLQECAKSGENWTVCSCVSKRKKQFPVSSFGLLIVVEPKNLNKTFITTETLCTNRNQR